MDREQLEQTINDHFETIITRSGYNHDGCSNLDTQKQEVAQKLGRLFFDYFIGSIYDVSWEGFNDQELGTIGRLLEDIDEAQRVGL